MSSGCKKRLRATADSVDPGEPGLWSLTYEIHSDALVDVLADLGIKRLDTLAEFTGFDKVPVDMRGFMEYAVRRAKHMLLDPNYKDNWDDCGY